MIILKEYSAKEQQIDKISTQLANYDKLSQLKKDVVEHCEAIARSYGYDGLSFQLADVTRDKLADTHIDMVVTLHACDVATDFALHYAIQKKADFIFSVPCCQHEVNNQISCDALEGALRYGLLKERLSALLTVY